MLKNKIIKFSLIFSIIFIVSCLFSISVFADDTKDTQTFYSNTNLTYDVSKKQPIVFLESDMPTYGDIFNRLSYGDTLLRDTRNIGNYTQEIHIQKFTGRNTTEKNDYYDLQCKITKASSTSVKVTRTNGIDYTNSKLNTNDKYLWQSSDGWKTTEKYSRSATGYFLIQCVNPDTGSVTSKITVPFSIIRNTKPTVSVNHIYLSAEEFRTKSKNGMSITDYIKSQTIANDAEGSKLNVEISDITSDLSAIQTNSDGTPKKTTSFVCTVSAEDTNLSGTAYRTSVPCYITVLADSEQIVTTYSSKTYTRAISAKYYPYNLKDIGKNSDGTFRARKKSDTYYFLDTTGQYLKIDGKEVGVDACLTSFIKPNGTEYKVTPLSKWVTNGNCSSLLISCLTRKTGDTTAGEFIESWSFERTDIKQIQKLHQEDGILDEHFYYNYSSNGYCELGNKKANEISRKTQAQSCGNGLTWHILNDTLYINALEGNYSYEMDNYYNDTGYIHNVFPKTWGTLAANQAPWANYSFSKIVLDDKITTIGSYAFYGLENLKEMPKIPSHCYKIGEGTFMNCINMNGDVLTKKVFEIGSYAFTNCSELKGKISLGDDALDRIGDYAFYNCGFKSSLTIPTSTATIGNYAFMECKNLTGNLTINDNVSSIGEYAFYGCISLDGDLKLPYALKEVKPFTFGNCIGLNGKLWLNDNLTKIGQYAFFNCTNVTGDVLLPDNLVSIENGAFKNCRSLKTTLKINKKLNYVGTDAFFGCGNITNIDNSEAKSVTIEPRAFYVSNSVTTKISTPKETSFYEYNYFGDNRIVATY